MKSTKLLAWHAIVVSSALVACSSAGNDLQDPDGTVAKTTKPLQSVGQLWNISRTDHFGNYWPAGTVPVCFETGSYGSTDATAVPNFDTFRTWIRSAVEDSFARVADLRFVHWGACPSKEHTEMAGWVAIYWSTDVVWSSVGMLPSTWTRMGYFLPTDTSPGTRDDFQITVRHEFAHALGFGHEYERTDNPNALWNCKDEDPEPGTIWTDFDTASITNASYWVPACGGAQPTGNLSPRDIWGLQRAYGRKKSGSIVGLGGRCVNTPGFNYTNGTTLVAYDCYGQTNDTWRRDLVGGLEVFRQQSPSATSHSMAMRSPHQVGATPVEIQSSTVTADNIWRLSGVRWKAIGNMCVAVRNPDAGDTRLIIEECASTDRQLWDWDYGGVKGRIHNRYTGTCANVANASTANNTPINTYFCGSPNPYPNEIFTTTARGEIMYGGKCLNVADYYPVSGAELQLYDCLPANTPNADLWYNELFHLSGQITHGIYGEPLTLVGSGALENISYNGAPIRIQQFGGQSNQVWDIYF